MPLCEWAWLCNLFAPDSDASTVPAAAEEVQKVAKQRYEASKKDQPAPTTPMNNIKKSQSADDAALQPKLRRDIQSKEVLGTNTEAKTEVKTTKSTAVKAKAAPNKQVKNETEKVKEPNTTPPPNRELELNGLQALMSAQKQREAAEASQAIRECLRRKSTDNFQNTPGRPSPAPSTSTSTATPTEKTQPQNQAPDGDQEHSSEDEEEIARLARIQKVKREAHARPRHPLLRCCKWEAKKKKKSDKKAKKAKCEKKRKQRKPSKSNSSSKSESEEPVETEAQKKKRLQKEEAKAEREKKQEAEKAKRKEEKEKTDAFKKDQRKGNQAIQGWLARSLSTPRNTKFKTNPLRSSSVVTAIMAEVKPHISALKTSRQKLQKSVDDAKVDQLGSLYADIESANNTLEVFNKFLAAYNVK
eukprot:s583_g32.t1